MGLIRDLGTAIGDATAAGAKRLKGLKDSKSRIIILLTDGDNNKGEIDPVPAAQLAAALGVKIYTIGIGIEQPCTLPVFDPATGKLQLDAHRQPHSRHVLQPANYTVLGKMSALSRGKFYRATNRRELQRIYNEIDRLEKTRSSCGASRPIGPCTSGRCWRAFGLLALELVLANTRLRRVP